MMLSISYGYKALALELGLAVAWLGRGNTVFELNRYDEALSAYDKALALDPRLAAASLGRGNVFFEIDQERSGVRRILHCAGAGSRSSPRLAGQRKCTFLLKALRGRSHSLRQGVGARTRPR